MFKHVFDAVGIWSCCKRNHYFTILQALTVANFSISSSVAPREARPSSCENSAKNGSASRGACPRSSWMQSLQQVIQKLICWPWGALDQHITVQRTHTDSQSTLLAVCGGYRCVCVWDMVFFTAPRERILAPGAQFGLIMSPFYHILTNVVIFLGTHLHQGSKGAFRENFF